MLKRKNKIEAKTPKVPGFSKLVLYLMKANSKTLNNTLMHIDVMGNTISEFGGFIIILHK